MPNEVAIVKKVLFNELFKYVFLSSHVRDPSVRPVSNTLALPIYENSHVVASIGLTWFSSALSQKDAVAALYPPLKVATEKITARLATLDGNRTLPVVKPSQRRPRGRQ